VGVGVFVLSVFWQRRHQVARWHRIEQRLPALFPGERSP
jgi:hypothetical protein